MTNYHYRKRRIRVLVKLRTVSRSCASQCLNIDDASPDNRDISFVNMSVVTLPCHFPKGLITSDF